MLRWRPLFALTLDEFMIWCTSIMELEGLGADIWKGIDAQDYVHKERESWD